MFKQILVPVDGSEPAERAVELGRSAARAAGLPLRLLEVVRHESDAADRRKYLEGLLAGAGGASVEVAAAEKVAPAIVVAARRDDSLICMSTHGRGGLGRALLGSVTEEVIRTANAPILQLDRCLVAARSRETPVTSDQGHAKGFGERDKSCVVGREVLAELPHPVGQGIMRISDNRQIGEVYANVSRPLLSEILRPDQTPQGVDDLHIDKVGSVEIAVVSQPSDQLLVRRAGGERRYHGRGIDDDHSPSRAERTAATIRSPGAPPCRALARKSTSARGGHAATRAISPSK